MAKAKKAAKKKASKSKAAARPAKKAAAKKAVSFIPKGYHTATPYMTVRDAAGAIEFYKRAFGAANPVRMDGPDGKVMHAELIIGDSHIMMGEENPQMGMPAPPTVGGSASGIMLYVPNVDQVFARAVAAGAKVEMPVADQFWGDRYGKLVDPYGHKWSVATHVEDMTQKEMARRGDEFMKQFAAKKA
jgi:PhnB protein